MGGDVKSHRTRHTSESNRNFDALHEFRGTSYSTGTVQRHGDSAYLKAMLFKLFLQAFKVGLSDNSMLGPCIQQAS